MEGQRASLPPILLANTTQEKRELVLQGGTTDTLRPQASLGSTHPTPHPEWDPDQKRSLKSMAFTVKSVTTKNILPKTHRL